MLIIQRPEIEAGEPEGNLQRFTIAPLEPGFGHTLGNSLRRSRVRSPIHTPRHRIRCSIPTSMIMLLRLIRSLLL